MIEGFKDTIDWYDRNAQKYAESARVVPEQAIESFLELMPPDPRVLDAGSGSGRDSRAFNARGARVVGADVSEGLLDVARRDIPDVEFVHGDFRALPFEDAVFDGVWSRASLVHLETVADVEKSLSEFHRVLKPEGVLYIYVKLQTGESETAVVSDTLSGHDRFFRYYTNESLQRVLGRVGFKILDTNYVEDEYGRSEVRWLEVMARKV